MQIMVDIEMADPQMGGHIMQLSAVAFDFGFRPHEAMEILSQTDKLFNVSFSYYGGSINDETMAWWDRAAPAACSLITEMPKVSIQEGLERFNTFVRSFLGNKANVWAKPPLFDLQVLRAAYCTHYTPPGDDVDLTLDPTPWLRKQEACARTLVWLADRVPRQKFRVPDMTSQGLVQHFALHDCVQQVIVAQAAYRALVENARGKGETASQVQAV
jgi:hypothetical protein